MQSRGRRLQVGTNDDEGQDQRMATATGAYTLHRQTRKGFPRNLYTVNNLGDLWELDVADMGTVVSND